jgi:YhcH/YjgK/YiaL family protein
MIAAFLGIFGCGKNNNPSSWSEEKIDKWFYSGEWKQGWQPSPDSSVNRRAFAISYFDNKERWDSAFSFLKNNNLSILEARRHDINGNALYVSITDYLTKNREDAKFEAHRKYIDIQYVVSGEEFIGISPITQKDSVLQAYDAGRDIEFMTVKQESEKHANPGNFFIFFPGDAHRPGLKSDSTASVRKIVVKILIDR